MENEIKFRVVLKKPTAGVDFGLQKGSGSNYETVQKQRSFADDLFFEFTVKVKKGKDAAPNFTGPFVQGPAHERFVYIDIGICAGQTNTKWSRRLKIPLSGITWNIIRRLETNSDSFLETHVPGVGKDGGPNCATVKPFEGWKLVRGEQK